MDLEQKSIERLKLASEMSLKYYKQPLIITTSGGKDSDICLHLAKASGIPYEVQHNLTTADAPQTIYHVRDQFRRLELEGVKCTVNLPYYKGVRTSMWALIPQKLMPPTRLARYCCQVLKEGGGKGRMITTGVRWAESNARKERGLYETVVVKKANRIILNNDNDDKRLLFENCKLQAKRVCNPIIDWKDQDVWGYIQGEGIDINPLYQCGFSRVGCIGCPMASNARYTEFRLFPKYKQLYINAFDRMLDARRAKGLPTTWQSGEEVMHWWLDDGVLPGQMEMEMEETNND